jgi:hypothetical protein
VSLSEKSIPELTNLLSKTTFQDRRFHEIIAEIESRNMPTEDEAVNLGRVIMVLMKAAGVRGRFMMEGGADRLKH